MIFNNRFVLFLDEGPAVRRQILPERCFVLILCRFFGALTFGENGLITHSLDAGFQVDPHAMQRAIRRAALGWLAAEAANFPLKLFSSLAAPSRSSFELA